jgi:predicted transcriptional regulator
VIRDYEPLGELEAAVMEVVWKHAPVTAREVCDRMTGRWERAYTTIMTTMDRLFRKGLLRRQKEGLAWQYNPVLSAQQFDRALADSLANRILAADQDIALHAFVDAAAKVDVALLARLRQLIDQRGKRAR